MNKGFDLLLAVPDHEQTLEAFAKNFFALVGINAYQERDSVHYVDEHYFVGVAGSVKFKVMLHDDEEHADLPFWVAIDSASQDPWSFDLQSFVSSLLIPKGWKVAEIRNFGRVAIEQRLDF